MHHRGIQHIISALIVTGVVTGLRFSPREMSHRVTLSIGMECKNRFFKLFFYEYTQQFSFSNLYANVCQRSMFGSCKNMTASVAVLMPSSLYQ